MDTLLFTEYESRRSRLTPSGVCIVLALSLFLPFSACGPGQEAKARQELRELGVPYDPDEFVGRAAKGDTHAVELLLTVGMNPDVKNQEGRTALEEAIENDQTEIVGILLKKTKHNMDYAIWKAAVADSYGVAELLLGKGASANAVNEHGFTILMKTAETGNMRMVRLLLDNGADVNAKSKQGVTALMLAAEAGRADVVRVLLNEDADVDVVDEEGRTALSDAKRRRHMDIVEMLTEAGARE